MSVLIATASWGLIANNTTRAGTITDSFGRALPAATITAVKQAIKLSCSGNSSAEGYYSIPLIATGAYELTVEDAGLETVVTQGTRLQPNASAPTHIALRVEPVCKTFPILGRVALQLPAEALNIFNHPSPGNPATGNRAVIIFRMLASRQWPAGC